MATKVPGEPLATDCGVSMGLDHSLAMVSKGRASRRPYQGSGASEGGDGGAW